MERNPLWIISGTTTRPSVRDKGLRPYLQPQFRSSSHRIRHRPRKLANYGSATTGIRHQPRSDFALNHGRQGTDFLDTETGRQKSPLRRQIACGDRNPGNEWPEIPAETPYLASCWKRAVCGDWMVETVDIELAAHHPVIEPVSNLSREREFPMQRLSDKIGPFGRCSQAETTPIETLARMLLPSSFGTRSGRG